VSGSSDRTPGPVHLGQRLGDRLAPVVGLSPRSPLSTRAIAGLCGLVPVALATLYRVVHNAPGTLPTDAVALATSALPVAIVGPAAAALLLAVTDPRPLVRVGLVFAGCFGVLAALSTAAWLPAAVGVTAGGGVVFAAHAGRASPPRRLRTTTVVGVLVAAVCVSLAATAGVDPGTLRPLGSAVALAGVALTPLVVGYGRLGVLAGALAGLLTFGAATSAPYVVGAVLLVGGGVVSTPLGLVVLAAAGGVTALVTAADRGQGGVALGSGLLLVAGVPATLLGALAVVVAVAFLAAPVEPAETAAGGGVQS
jgi:hypothetical protein